MRTSFDLSPLRRTSVGFDKLFDLLESQPEPGRPDAFPPFDLERSGEDAYRITLAVAGFQRHEIEIVVQTNLLVIKGTMGTGDDDRGRYLHRGIAARSFERRFQLADHIEVRAACLRDGLLILDLVRDVPEAMKPRRIEIGAAANDRLEAPRGDAVEAA